MKCTHCFRMSILELKLAEVSLQIFAINMHCSVIKLPKNVCLWKQHENIFTLGVLHKVVPSILVYSHNFPETFLCDMVRRDCWLNSCDICRDEKRFTNQYALEDDVQDVTWCVETYRNEPLCDSCRRTLHIKFL